MMRKSWKFKPRLTQEEAEHLKQKYLAYGAQKEKAAEQAGKRLVGNPNVEDFRLIFEWKTRGRGRSRLDLNADDEVLDALSLASKATSPRSSIAVLVGLYGVAVPVASAVMAMMKPIFTRSLTFAL
jgi:hypothetical protein